MRRRAPTRCVGLALASAMMLRKAGASAWRGELDHEFDSGGFLIGIGEREKVGDLWLNHGGDGSGITRLVLAGDTIHGVESRWVR